ncbi:unnamed protein product [Arabis nemorensis]|uniref:Uncharacterized protein n=1 Tax=Arabis nemorensis TaxID=586526 RepID=A0A565AYS8_9BRAS|nr:unnamed protein product [Arabis nemorensis]
MAHYELYRRFANCKWKQSESRLRDGDDYRVVLEPEAFSSVNCLLTVSTTARETIQEHSHLPPVKHRL